MHNSQPSLPSPSPPSLSAPPSLSPPRPLPTLSPPPSLRPHPTLPSLQQIHCPFQPKQSPSSNLQIIPFHVHLFSLYYILLFASH